MTLPGMEIMEAMDKFDCAESFLGFMANTEDAPEAYRKAAELVVRRRNRWIELTLRYVFGPKPEAS